MIYCLRDNVSYCRVDDGVILLDVTTDRYFRLPNSIEQAFITYVDGGVLSETDVDVLVKRRILTDQPFSAPHQATIAIDRPQRSNVEKRRATERLRPKILLEVLALICSMHWQLKRRPLKTILDDVVAYRARMVAQARSVSSAAIHRHLTEATDAFWRARPYVPIEPVCLLDSLALTQFLARRNLHSNIVFGVTTDPFTAHCWVQSETLVLNDTVGNANAHTVIRVV